MKVSDLVRGRFIEFGGRISPECLESGLCEVTRRNVINDLRFGMPCLT